MLHLYISKVPEKAIQDDIFYLRPLAKVPSDPSAPWFMCTAVGKNTLSKMLATMCTEAGISGRKTNHSLRAYAATELFRAGIPEKVIQDRSGHRTLEGLRKYERISDKHRQEACKALTTDKIIPSAANTNVSEDNPVPVSSFSGQENLPPSGEVMLAGSAKSNPPVPLQNQHPSLQVMTNSPYYQMQQQIPSFSFGSATLSGCTINIFQAPTVVKQSNGCQELSKEAVSEVFSDF